MALKKSPIKLKTLKVKPEKEEDEKEVENNSMEEGDCRPTVSFNDEQLPQIKDWTLSGSYKLVMEVEMTGIQLCDWGDNKGKKVASFRVTKLGVSE